jgi:hypothetical protein
MAATYRGSSVSTVRQRDERQLSVFGKTAPSWAYASHQWPNGYAVVACALGVLAGILISTPGGYLVVPGAVVALAAIGFATAALRRAREHPWLGGRILALAGLGSIGAGVVLAVLWWVLDA